MWWSRQRLVLFGKRDKRGKCGRTGYTGPTGFTEPCHDPPDPSAYRTITSLQQC